MELQTISQVAKAHDISTRMLRYYEEAGLIKSIRNEGNSYRYYDEDALVRVRQITILRKLQIPVKQICVIMNTPDTAAVIEIFRKKITELDSEITALSTIKAIMDRFVRELEKAADLRLNLDFLGDDSILKLSGALSMIPRNIKDNLGVRDLDKAAEVLSKLLSVRVVYLPPMTVASAFFTGNGAYEHAWRAIDDFVKRSGLLQIKPDLRVFRYDRANATGHSFGHEVWVSVPDGFAVPAPLTKKTFHGGQYAAHVLGDDGYLTYLGLQDWINESDRYQYDYDGNLTRVTPPVIEVNSFGGIRLDPEEILNYNNYKDSGPPASGDQIDVLFPIKDYIAVNDEPVEIPGSEEKCGFKASIVTKSKFRIMGFTGIMKPRMGDGACQKGEDKHCVGCGNCGGSPDKFERELKADGRMELLNRFRKPGAPLLGFGSHDMDSQMRGGWRWTVCLEESGVTDARAFLEHRPYVRTIDASKWVIFEHIMGDSFDDHAVCRKLGYTWNGAVSGSFYVRPEGLDTPGVVFCWYPVK